MKWIRQVLWEDPEQTRFCPQTDGQMDWQCETSLPPFQLRWSRGIIRSRFCTYYDGSAVMKRAVMKSQIAGSMGPMWGLPGADRTQVGPMLAPWTLLSGMCTIMIWLEILIDSVSHSVYVLWWCHNRLHCNRLWHHQRTYTKWVRYSWWVKIIFLLSFVGPLCCVRNMVMYVLHWRTDYTLTPVVFWCLFPCMLHNSWHKHLNHYNDAIMTVSNHQPHHCLLKRLFRHRSKKTLKLSASLAFVRGIHWWSVNSPHKGPVTRKMFPFDDVIMNPLIDV